jgi:hypothetical protein
MAKEVSKKKGGCSSCKKKPPVTELPPLMELPNIPTEKEIKEAYYELTNQLGLRDDKKEFVKDIYFFLFNEVLDLNCTACVSRQARKFHNFLKFELKLI